MIRKRGTWFAVIAVSYVLAAALGVVTAKFTPGDLLIRLLAADAAATVFVFIFSVAFRNASVYDPYWSVQPIVILALLARGGVGSAGLVLIAAVSIWGIRLTANWAYTFRGLGHEDWRYVMLREKSGKLYPIVNFFGIHMAPTVIVLFCVWPAARVVVSGEKITPAGAALSLICVFAVVLQTVADIQMHRFRSKGTGGLIRTGLWKYSRHPNYLGEILMWWGVAAVSFTVFPLDFTVFIGAALNTALFLAVSIPMADRRYSVRDGYGEYKKETRMLLPIKKRAD